ncbi:DUF1631 family protein [Noviherbaspirillum saxi]|nr:DUF1631 family protein [Noviherbaspirillum saxi]
MASRPVDGNNSVNLIPAERREEILHELAVLASNTANAQIDAMTTRLSEALLRASTACIDPAQARLHFNAASLLKKNRYPFYYVVSERLAAMLKQEVQSAANPDFQPVDTGDAPPSLAPDVDIDKKLCLVKASRAVENEHTERMIALGMRLGGLLGRNPFITAENPFRPYIFLSVIHDAWCEFQPDISAHHLVFPLLGPELCLDMGPILHALNAALVKLGVMPQLVQVHRAADGTESVQAIEEPDSDPLLPRLRRLFPDAAGKEGDKPLSTGFPALFDDAAVVASAARNALLGHLAGPERNRAGLLDELRRDAARIGLGESDDKVLELVAKIFAVIHRHEQIATELKTVLLQLQVPLLKAALVKPEFFFRRSYPARRAIDMLIDLSAGWEPAKGASDSLYLLLVRSVIRIADEADRRPAVFADVVSDLDAYRRREETAASQALKAWIAQGLQDEKMLEAKRSAERQVALRIGTGEIVAFVEAFLEEKWVPVLTLAYSVSEQKPQAVDHALKTMDDLVWSVKPKITADERKELLAKLPSVVAALNKWLDLIRWDDEGRVRFFNDLAKCHASIVRAPLELSPERQVQIALALAKQAAERRLRRQANARPEPVADAFDAQVSALEQGAWIDFGKGEHTRRLRLGWVSPLRNLYIFGTRERQEALSMSAEEVAAALREGRAHLVPGAGLVGQALAEALGIDHGDSANNDSNTSQSAA